MKLHRSFFSSMKMLSARRADGKTKIHVVYSAVVHMLCPVKLFVNVGETI